MKSRIIDGCRKAIIYLCNMGKQNEKQRRRHHLEAASRSAQDLMDMLETEYRAAGSTGATAAATANSIVTTNNVNVRAPDELSSNNEITKRAPVPKSTENSNTSASTAQNDDQSTQSGDNTAEYTEETERRSDNVDDITTSDAGQGQLPPSSGDASGWHQDDLINENDEEQKRRKAEFAAKRHRHDSDDSLQAHYDSIFADIEEEEEGNQQPPQPQQGNNNNEENTSSVNQNASRNPSDTRHHLLMAMEMLRGMDADDDNEDESE